MRRQCVTRALPRPRELEQRLTIDFPAAGTIFLANGIEPRAVHAQEPTWFFNGRVVASPGEFVLPPGAYELRLVDEFGRTATSRFQVRTQ